MNTHKRTTHNQNKKTRRKSGRNLPKEDDVLLSNVSKTISNNSILKRVANNVEETLTPTNMKRYSVLVTHMLENKIQTIGSYSPSINKRLASIREDSHTDIFGCGAESVLQKTQVSNTFEIRIGRHKHGEAICIPAVSNEAREIFMKNFKSNKKLNPNNIIVPMQRHSNCWFNTMFMCFFVSDKGRKFMRFFRQLMIEGKLIDGTLIEPTNLSFAFILFNAAIEACHNNGNIKENYQLALNTNNIIMNIYNSVTLNMSGIKNIKEYGNPYMYYHDIMEYLDAGKKSIKIERYTTKIDVKDFFNNTHLREPPDVVVITLIDYKEVDRASASDFNKKPEKVKYNGAVYEIDSVICRDKTKHHFCCGIKCNKQPYLFDGAVFSKLQRRSWTKWLNKDYDWAPHGSSYIWNFMKGYSMLFYYRIS
jgi:hypothetical protein